MGSVLFDPYLIGLIFFTTILGVFIGVLPGLGATTGAALLLPFTLTMEPVHAITVLATIYVSATFAGSITAILINTPGTSAAAATTFDGFPLAQRGEAGRALGVAVVSSTIGGIFSVIVLCIAAPLLARVAYQFRPPEYFALTLFGLSMLASISSGGAIKNLIGGVFGVWLATIGAEKSTSIERFMFGNYELYEGLSFVPVMIGLFALSELLVQSKKAHMIAERISMKAVKLPTREDYKRIWKTILRSCGIGTFIGILPAEGATVASMIGYSEARQQVTTVYQIFGAMLLANIMFLGMGLYAAKGFARISLVPTAILWPIVFALSVIGAYSLSSSLLDVWIALIFGVIGFFARRHGFAVAPIAVGLILGEMVEINLQNSLKMFEGDWWMILAQPLAAFFLVLAFLGLCGPIIFSKLMKRGE